VNRRQALNQTRVILAENHIEDASLEGEILLRHVLDIDRAQLFADLNLDISSAQETELKSFIVRRCNGEPSAYITGHKEFYGLDFVVNPRVLIPRPETEMLVEKTIELCRARAVSTVADIGTGCGAIAVSLAVNVPSVNVYATDISLDALAAAAQNAAQHRVEDRIIFLVGDLLEPLEESVDIIVGNLPYVRKADMAAGFEPEQALDGGIDGLDKIRKLCPQADKKLNKNGSLILEIGQGQVEAVCSLVKQSFPSGVIEVNRDLAGIDRMVTLRLT
jgi:release factor glutamine methyltransferase